MKVMRNKKFLTILALTVLFLSSCSFDPQPPKTSGSESNYLLPPGELPSAEDLAAVDAARMEYENAVE